VTRRCLGARIADLADGRLTPAETERAYAHVASCPACRVALEAQRTASTVLGSTTGIEPGADFLSRLAGIPEQGVPAPSADIPSQPSAGVRPAGGASVRPRAAAPASTGPGRRRSRQVAVGAAASAALALAAYVGVSSATAGAVLTPQPAIGRVVDTFAVEHAVSVDRMPLTGPLIQPVGYAAPSGSASPSPAP
jgi:anti-sigma factor RsiW